MFARRCADRLALAGSGLWGSRERHQPQVEAKISLASIDVWFGVSLGAGWFGAVLVCCAAAGSAAARDRARMAIGANAEMLNSRLIKSYPTGKTVEPAGRRAGQKITGERGLRRPPGKR